VRLLQRTTRRFVVTEVGERFYGHCRAVLEEARAAQDAVEEVRSEPRGVVRVSCPVSLVQTVLGHIVPDFLAQHPKMQVRLQATDRRVDLIGEGFDIAVRVRSKLDTDATLVVRTFGQSNVLLVASPDLLNRYGRPREPADVSQMPALSNQEHEGAQSWELLDKQGERVIVDIQPRLICGDFNALLQSCKQGIGVALLPEFVCGPAISRGELEVVLPDWSVPQGTMHFVYPSRRGLLPAVRSFVDFLAERLPKARAEYHKECETVASDPSTRGAVALRRMLGSEHPAAFGRPNE